MKETLEVVVVVAVLLLSALLFREWRVRAGASYAGGAVPVGVTSDPPPPGTPAPARAVQALSPIKLHARARVLRDAPPPPPPDTNGD